MTADLWPHRVDTVRLERRARANLWPVILGQSVSLLGDYVALLFALPVFVVALTGSARDLGLTAAAETFPMLLFGFAAGVMLDRIALRRALIFADLTRGAAFALLALSVIAGVSRVWMVFGAAFVVGSMSVVFDSGLEAIMPSLLTDEMLVHANSRLQLARNLSVAAGPALGGLIVAGFGGFEAAFLFETGTYVVSAALLVLVRQLRSRPAPPSEPFGRSFRAGLLYLLRDQRLRWATTGATLTNLTFAPLAATLPLFAKAELGIRGNDVLGWFFAGFGLLGAIGVMTAPLAAARFGLGRTFAGGMLMLGAGFAVAATMNSFLAVVPIGVALAGVSLTNVAFVTMRQKVTPTELLGRVIATSRTISWAGLPIGAALGGLIADHVGLVPVYLVGSVIIMIAALLLTLTPLWERIEAEYV